MHIRVQYDDTADATTDTMGEQGSQRLLCRVGLGKRIETSHTPH
jgi:hypothetical protein